MIIDVSPELVEGLPMVVTDDDVTNYSISRHRLLCHSLVRPVFMATSLGLNNINFVLILDMEAIVDNKSDKILIRKVLKKNTDFICTTKKGIDKKENEDAFLIVQNDFSTLFVIFDGVGSAKNAKKATLLSKKFIKKNLNRYIEDSLKLDLLLYDVNNYLLAQPQKELYTTYTLLFIPYESDHVYFSSLGDSRLYKMNNQFIEQVTKDDSYSSNVITKCLGLKNYEIYDFETTLIRRDAFSFLLCTDGFYNLMERDKIFYFETFCKKRLSSIKSVIRNRIKDNNFDDATLIFVRQYV